mmetsp:Transcript_40035/g.83952  ORF Transcript_40035/g.83952 Transcript_40035/m.83952 type:complete len:272 (-) Transcript_40035:890-1705(-)
MGMQVSGSTVLMVEAAGGTTAAKTGLEGKQSTRHRRTRRAMARTSSGIKSMQLACCMWCSCGMSMPMGVMRTTRSTRSGSACTTGAAAERPCASSEAGAIWWTKQLHWGERSSRCSMRHCWMTSRSVVPSWSVRQRSISAAHGWSDAEARSAAMAICGRIGSAKRPANPIGNSEKMREISGGSSDAEKGGEPESCHSLPSPSWTEISTSISGRELTNRCASPLNRSSGLRIICGMGMGEGMGTSIGCGVGRGGSSEKMRRAQSGESADAPS